MKPCTWDEFRLGTDRELAAMGPTYKVMDCDRPSCPNRLPVPVAEQPIGSSTWICKDCCAKDDDLMGVTAKHALHDPERGSFTCAKSKHCFIYVARPGMHCSSSLHNPEKEISRRMAVKRIPATGGTLDDMCGSCHTPRGYVPDHITGILEASSCACGHLKWLSDAEPAGSEQKAAFRAGNQTKAPVLKTSDHCSVCNTDKWVRQLGNDRWSCQCGNLVIREQSPFRGDGNQTKAPVTFEGVKLQKFCPHGVNTDRACLECYSQAKHSNGARCPLCNSLPDSVSCQCGNLVADADKDRCPHGLLLSAASMCEGCNPASSLHRRSAAKIEEHVSDFGTFKQHDPAMEGLSPDQYDAKYLTRRLAGRGPCPPFPGSAECQCGGPAGHVPNGVHCRK